MSIFSVFSIVGLLAAFGLGTVSSHQAIGGRFPGGVGAGTRTVGDAQSRSRPSDVVGMKTVRRPLDTVGGTPAH